MVVLPVIFLLSFRDARACAQTRNPDAWDNSGFRVRAEEARPGITSYPWIACQTRSGDAGMARFSLPMASVMALMTAADAPIAPASPQPLTPSGLPGHSVMVCETLNEGRSSARGMA